VRRVITDTHAHLQGSQFDADREDVIARAHGAGVTRMIIVGTDVASSQAAFALCAGREGFFPTAGIHPHDARAAGPAEREAIEEMCARPDCVAVGETGLDWFKEFSPRAAQIENFAWHAALARRLDLPLVVHCRDAHEDTLAVLRAAASVRGVMHCYTMGAEELPAYLELGFTISFSGIVTFPKNERNRAAARAVPLDRILFETDCPYLAPQTKRGRRNEPAFVADVVADVARLRNMPADELARAASENAARLFGFATRSSTEAASII
jgi:TatD DNase family protein